MAIRSFLWSFGHHDGLRLKEISRSARTVTSIHVVLAIVFEISAIVSRASRGHHVSGCVATQPDCRIVKGTQGQNTRRYLGCTTEQFGRQFRFVAEAGFHVSGEWSAPFTFSLTALFRFDKD